MTSPHTLKAVFAEPPTRQILHQAMVNAYYDTAVRTSVTSFNALAGKPIYGIDKFFGPYPGNWGQDFADFLSGSISAAVLPLMQDSTLKTLWVGWMPIHNDADQQTMKDIIAGKEDAYIRRTADQCKAFGYTIYIKFGIEMNIHQQPGQWAANPSDFVGAWRHVVDVFRAQGVANVQWV
jgi:hypothetical protein